MRPPVNVFDLIIMTTFCLLGLSIMYLFIVDAIRESKYEKERAKLRRAARACWCAECDAFYR